MAFIVDPGSALQDLVDEAALAGPTGIHQRYQNVYALLNGNLEVDNIKASAKTGTGKLVLESAVTSTIAATIPIGSIIPHYDFNGTVSIGSSFRYCDGSVISATGSPITGLTLPDLSNRYLVGFGTEGGGDIDTAAWATTAVGNASHQVDLLHNHTVTSHSHIVNAHNHGMASHTHTGPSHTHGPGSLQFATGAQSLGGGVYLLGLYNVSGSLETVYDSTDFVAGAGAKAYRPLSFPGTGLFYTANGTGVTAASGTGTTGTPSDNFTSYNNPGTSGEAPPTTNSLSATQNIQPRSVRVRFIMRVL